MELLRLAYKNIIHRKARFFLTTLAVVIGVMFVSGVFIFTDGLRSTFGNLADDIAGSSDLVVRSHIDFGERDQAPPVPVELETVLAGVPGVRSVEPGIVEFGLTLLDTDGVDIEPGFGGGAPVLGISWSETPQDAQDTSIFLNPSYGNGSGRRPDGINEFAVDFDTANDNGLILGEVYEIIFPAGEYSGHQDRTLVGVFNFAEAEENQTLGAILLAFDQQSAIAQLNDNAGFDQYDIYVEAGADTGKVSADIEAALTANPQSFQAIKDAGIGIEVVETSVLADEAADLFNTVVDIFRNVLLGFAFVILIVSAFVIFNTFSIVLDQRIKELGMLRALGLSGRQLQQLVLGEAVIVGIFATIVGFAAGFGLFYILGAILDSLGGGDFFSDLPLVFEYRTFIAAACIGIGITVLSALPPSIRSRRVPPIAAIREGVSATRQTGVRLRPVLGGIVLVAGAAIAAVSLPGNWIGIVFLSLIATFAVYWGGARIKQWFGHISVLALGVIWLILGIILDLKAGEAFALYGVGAVIVFIGVNLVSPIFSGRVARGIGAPVRKIYGIVGTLGVENSARNPKRTSATSAALMVGLALVSTVAVLTTSLRATFSDVLENSVNSDWILCRDDCNDENNAFSANVGPAVDALPEVESTLTISFISEGIAVHPENISGDALSESAQADSEPDSILGVAPVDTPPGEEPVFRDIFDIIGTDVSNLQRHFDLDILDVASDVSVENGAFVYEDRAKAYNLQVGSKVLVNFASGSSAELEVVGIYGDNRIFNNDWIINQSLLDQHIVTQRSLFISVIEAPGFTESEVRKALNGAPRDIDPNVVVQTREEFNDQQAAQINNILIVVSVFLGLSFIVAILGIANTLALSVFERTREIGLLRAVGMKRVQVRRMVRMEGLIIALFGCIMGIGLGVIFGIIGAYVIPDSFISTLSIEPLFLVIYGLIGGLAGLLSSLFPAIRAGRLNILDAISHE